jgi:CBS-domain-containing membrane protein
MFDKKILLNNFLSALGACICISMLSYLHFSDYGEIWLIPPFGATMVLVMAVHNSPLAEPRNIFLGHTLSALSGVIIFSLMGASAISLGIAVGLSVFVMTSFNAIHPPAGANPYYCNSWRQKLIFCIDACCSRSNIYYNFCSFL